MRSNTKEFWERVQEEYNNHPERSHWICFRSMTFAEAWMYEFSGPNEKDELKKLAKEFVKAKWWKFYWIRFDKPNVQNLFPNKKRTAKDSIAIRKDFIKWCIKKFK